MAKHRASAVDLDGARLADGDTVLIAGFDATWTERLLAAALIEPTQELPAVQAPPALIRPYVKRRRFRWFR